MPTEIIIIDSDFENAAKFATQMCNLENFVVTKILASIDDLVKLNLDDTILLFKLTSDYNYNYDKDFSVINNLIDNTSNFNVFLISKFASKDLILKSYEYKFSGFIEFDFFINNCTSILISLCNLSGFYISPLKSNVLLHKKVSEVVISQYLSKKQNDVAFYLIKGNKYNEIASILGLSVNTVRMHVRIIYKKLKVKSKYQLMCILNQENELIYRNTLYDYGNDSTNVSTKTKLTSKELTILRFLNEGKSSKDIANELSITLNTTRYHIRKLKTKSAI